jgi:diaminopimelate epimerase
MLPFVKVEAGGNDFVLVDARRPLPAGGAALAQDLCRRRRSVGADGLLLVDPGEPGDDGLTLVHHEPDGARTFCLNGVRAAARWAADEGLLASGALRTDAGRLAVSVDRGGVEVALPPPRLLERRRATCAGRTVEGTFVDVGNPQFVVEVSPADLEDPGLMAWGRALRHLAAVFPGGTNVCFAARRPGGALALRTYERGVEDETLSCGTGAVATACALGAGDEVRLLTRGGDELRVGLAREGARVVRVRARGPARVVARGSVAVAEVRASLAA